MWAVAAAAICLAAAPAALADGGAAAALRTSRAKVSPKLERDSEETPTATGERRLRLCNGYASPEPMEMRRLEDPKLVEYPLAYKACHDYVLPMTDGDRLQFKVGEMDIGTFAVRGLPSTSSLLLLIPHRQHQSNNAVTFQSHIFMESKTPQVAIIDAYQGPSHAVPLIEGKSQEELRFNTVVAVAPGRYNVGVRHQRAGEGRAASLVQRLDARSEENYVVLRVGADDKFPESLIVFPAAAESAAPAHTCILGLVLAAALHAVVGSLA